MDMYQLNFLYGIVLDLPDCGVRQTFLNFIVEECRAAQGEWINWIVDLRDNHAVKQHWLSLQI